MKRNVEARLAKLEAGAGVGVPDFIFAEIEEHETKEEFDKRVERLVRESEQRTGCAPCVLMVILNHAG